MTNNKIIDITLKKLYEVSPSPLHDILYDHFKLIGKDINGFTKTKKRIREIMYHEGLITNLDEHSTITHLGRSIIENHGGWIKYIKRKKIDRILTFTAQYIYPIFALIISVYAIHESSKSDKELLMLRQKLELIESSQNYRLHKRSTQVQTLDTLKCDSLVNNLKVKKN